MKQRGEGTTFDFRALLEKQNRTRLAVVLGGAAMLLLLLSELLPATPPAEPSAASASQASVYREQLEAQLQDLIGQIDGAGATTVMVTLETGEETVYATDTQSGQTQSQETHAENEIETMVKAKGFADCLCFLQSGRADLTVMTSGDALTAAQVAQIRDIVLSKSSVTAQNITIVEVK